MGFEWRSYLFALITAIFVFKDTFSEWFRDASGFAEKFIYLPLGVLFFGLLTWGWGAVFKVLFELDKEEKEKKIDKEVERKITENASKTRAGQT